MKPQLICFDCGIRRRVVVSVVDEKTKRVVGHRCKKCLQKMYVDGRSKVSDEGNGWRQRLFHLAENLKKQKSMQAPKVKPEHLQPMADAFAEKPLEIKPSTKKQTMRNKISSFFSRRAS